jgi:hypothetical protein
VHTSCRAHGTPHIIPTPAGQCGAGLRFPFANQCSDAVGRRGWRSPPRADGRVRLARSAPGTADHCVRGNRTFLGEIRPLVFEPRSPGWASVHHPFSVGATLAVFATAVSCDPKEWCGSRGAGGFARRECPAKTPLNLHTPRLPIGLAGDIRPRAGKTPARVFERKATGWHTTKCNR